MTWDLRSPRRVGVERFWFGGQTISLVCEGADGTGARAVAVRSSGPLELAILWRGKTTTVHVPAGEALQLQVKP